MSKNLPQSFPQYSGGSAVASYSYTDISEGTGTQSFYAQVAEDSSGDLYILHQNALHSETQEISATGTNATFRFLLSGFNLPKQVKGTALIDFSLTVAGASSNDGKFTFTIEKYDGSTYTSIGTDYISRAASAVETKVLPITLTETHFKKGDQLVLKIELHGGSGTNVYVGVDPQNQDSSHFTASSHHTDLIFYCPFKINI